MHCFRVCSRSKWYQKVHKRLAIIMFIAIKISYKREKNLGRGTHYTSLKCNNLDVVVAFNHVSFVSVDLHR